MRARLKVRYGVRAAFMAICAAAVMIAAAFLVARRATADLDWPNDGDEFREIAAARAVLNQGFGADPYYAGEHVWYNPLTSVLIAAASVVTHTPLHIAATRGGAYVNLLAPAGFFLLVAALFGWWRAIVAVAVFLFLQPAGLPPWMAASYSPWLYPICFAQGFFYLTLSSWVLARRGEGLAQYGLTGLLLGLTFLAHTAPAVLFGVIASFDTALAIAAGRGANGNVRRRARGWIVVVVVALVVSAPFLRWIVGHYRLHLVNTRPNDFAEPLMRLGSLPRLLWASLGITYPLAIVGWWSLQRPDPARDPGARRLLAVWIVTALLLLGWGYAVQVLQRRGLSAHTVVPTMHFLFYFNAGVAILAAVGLHRMATILVTRFGPRYGPEPWLSIVPLLPLIAVHLPAYLRRYDFVGAREEAIARGRDATLTSAFAWVAANARPTDVFLTADEDEELPCSDGVFAVGPAGAKVVCVNPVMSNPYVDWEARVADARRMFAALAARDAEGFRALARRYGVTHVLARGKRAEAIDAAGVPWLALAEALPGARIYRLRP
jgi:hypothetical protein